MKSYFLVTTLLLLSLTNFNIFEPNGLAPITPFIAIIPLIIFIISSEILKNYPTIKYKKVFTLCIFLTFISLVNIYSVKITSILYSFVFLSFYIFINYYKKNITSKQISILSKTIVILYAFNALTAKVFYLIFDTLKPIDFLFQGTPDLATGEMRYQGFSSEPSYAAFIIVTSMIVYFKTTNDSIKTKNIIFILTLTSIVLFRAFYGYILISMFILSLIIKEISVKKSKKFLFSMVIPVIFIILLFQFAGSENSRFSRIFSFVLSGNISLDEFNIIDSSAFMRVAPTVAYFENSDLFSISTYLGNGAGSSSYYFGNIFNDSIGEISSGYETGTMNLGFFPAFFYDYGLLGVALVYFLVLRCAWDNMMSLEFFVISLLLVNANFNTQIFWYVWAMFFLMKISLIKQGFLHMKEPKVLA